MSKIFSTALFVSCAAAQLTTSAWMPGSGDSGISYEASVIDVKDDRTTLSLALQGMSDLTEAVEDMAQTVTLQGNTYYAYSGVVAEQGITITVVGECSRSATNEDSATCNISSKGLGEALSSACSEAGASDELCASGAVETALSTTLPEGYFTMAQIVVTAGADSLPSASAAATPSASGASATGSPSSSPSASASKPSKSSASSSEPAASSGASKTSEPTAQSTNAAPLMTMAPALAGLGAAAAFFL